MLTIGIGYVLRGLITIVPGIGTETHTLPVPYKDQSLRLGELVLSAEQLVVIGATGVLCVLLFAMFRYSKLGIAMQAASQNQLAAYYMGIPVQRLNGLAWGLAAVVAAVLEKVLLSWEPIPALAIVMPDGPTTSVPKVIDGRPVASTL